MRCAVCGVECAGQDVVRNYTSKGATRYIQYRPIDISKYIYVITYMPLSQYITFVLLKVEFGYYSIILVLNSK